jgi:gliding motility-associated-like protein
MHKLILIIGAFIFCASATAQDFSNKGKEFWVAYGNHVRMFETITAQNQAERMELYMTSDVNTTGTVDIPGISFTATFTVTANQITTIQIPRSAGLLDEGVYNLGIHVTAAKPIVVYSFIYVSAVSGATLCLPVTTLNREYYSVNFTQVSNSANSYSYFDVIATDTGTTTVEIIPTQNTKGGHAAGTPYSINLTQGQIYQALGVLTSNVNPFKGVDLTGTQIRSISTATTKCKKIAVFCGSSKISIGCSGSGTSDNLYQQMYPVTTWGKTYITVPSVNIASTADQYNFYRIFKSDPSATVKLNGAVLPNAGFVNNQYYEFNTNQANFIESDQPILVAQYFSTGGCDGNRGNGDPEMIYLNPIEQTISNVTLNSMQPVANTNINEHHINIVLKNIPAVISSFKIDGISTGSFKPLSANNSYAYAQIQVTKGTHNLACDSGFNAIAYGFGNAESYGYSAGTNLKDLYQFVSIHNQYATVNFPAGCKNSPFRFSMTFPYQPTSIKWLFKGLFADTTISSPVYDSSWVVNGRTLYEYTISKNYIITAIGTYPITIIANNPTGDGCSGEQQIDYDLQIFERPVAAFLVTQTGCISDPVLFTDTTNGNGRPVISWIWKFGDGGTSAVKSPSHTYSTAGSYVVSFSSVTDIGCLSDTTLKTLLFTAPPIPAFSPGAATCVNKVIKFTDASTPLNGGIAKWSWDFGDGTLSTVQSPPHTYSSTGQYTIKLGIETVTGCKKDTAVTIKVNSIPQVNFSIPEVCLNDPSAAFTDSSSISDNSASQFSYLWTFGDPNAGSANPNTSTLKNPSHKYNVVGNYDILLQVTSKDGCSNDTTRKFTVNGAVPRADFAVSGAGPLCSNQPVTLSDMSSVDFGSITRVEIYWDYASDPTVKTVDENPVAGKSYIHKYPEFGSPASLSYQVVYIAYSGISCMQQQTKTVTVLASPSIKFDTILPVCQEAPAFQVTTAREIYGFTGIGTYSGSGITSLGLFTPASAGAGNKVITYQFAASDGCSTQKSQAIIVYPTPLADAGPNRIILQGGSITIDAKAAPNSTYLWSPATAIDNTTILTPNVSPVNNITYRLTVTSSNGCTASDDVMVTVLKEVKVPNAFSPNGDGINDTWNILFLESYPGAIVEVYNRYGQLVYRSTGYNTPWDGRYNGTPLPFGTYYWIINPKNGRAAITGSVTIIR